MYAATENYNIFYLQATIFKGSNVILIVKALQSLGDMFIQKQDHIASSLRAQIFTILPTLLSHKEEQVRELALRVVMIAGKNKQARDAMIQEQAYVTKLLEQAQLTAQKVHVRIFALKTLTSIGSEKHGQALLALHVIPAMIQMCQQELDELPGRTANILEYQTLIACALQVLKVAIMEKHATLLALDNKAMDMLLFVLNEAAQQKKDNMTCKFTIDAAECVEYLW